MSDGWLYVLLIVAGALGVVGAIYRVTDTASWPTWLRPVGAGAWYALAAVGGAVAVLWAWRDDAPDDDSDAIGTADTEPMVDEPTADDYERPPVEAPDDDRPTPEGGDGEADLDYWRD